MELGLLGRQGELVAAVAATGTPVVIVLVSGRPVSMPHEAALASAVLHAWVPGEAGPQAIAQVLFGDVSPGGKMPITTPQHVGQVPLYYGHRPTGGRSEWHQDYVDGPHRPLWPFGHGMSYSRFELSGLRVMGSPVSTDGEVALSLDVANVGTRAADEVVQVYVRDLAASVTRPVKELKGFVRLALAPGERRTVTFVLHAEHLAFTGVDGRLVIEPGRHLVMAGTSCVDLPLEGEFEVGGEPRWLVARDRFLSRVEIV
jgi:beta-glucosidase